MLSLIRVFEGITKTYLYNFDHLKPLFYIVKRFTNGSNEYPKSMFWAEIWKISLLIWKFSVFGGEIFYIEYMSLQKHAYSNI